jgi:hypothetical protein
MKTPPSTEALAKWLQEEAEVWFGCAANEEDRWRARRLQECAAELMRFHRMKVRFKDQLSPLRTARPTATFERTARTPHHPETLKNENMSAKAFQIGNWVRTSIGWRGQIVGVRVVNIEVIFDVEHEDGYPTKQFLLRELTAA